MNKNPIIINSIFSAIFILSLISMIVFVADKVNIAKHKLIFNKDFKLENPNKKDIEEMDFIYQNLSSNQIILTQGFVVANDFLTYLRIKNYHKDSYKKIIILENIDKQQKLLNNWDKDQKLNFILSCRYTNCKRDSLNLNNLFVNFKSNSSIESKRIDFKCLPNNEINDKLKNFGLYDCFEDKSQNN